MKRRRPRQAIPEYLQTPGILLQPEVHLRMQKGINLVVDAIRPTLGPLPRIVAIEKIPSGGSPELLDNGGLIARRIIDLKDPDENMGAMFIRGSLWRLYEKVGDGTATAAVIFQSIYNQGLRYISAGGNTMLLKEHLEIGMRIILNALDQMTTAVETRGALTQVALSVCYDEDLARTLGEIFDLIGEYGLLQIQSGRGRGIEREFIEGSYWNGGLYAKDMIRDIAKQRTQYEDGAILLTDLEIEEPEQLLPVLRAAVQAQVPNLVIMAGKFSDKVAGLLTANQKSMQVQVVAVKVPGFRLDDQMNALEDLAVLTGGQSFFRAAGDTLQSITPESFGFARKIWADMNYLGVVGGKGDPLRRREHIDKLRNAYLLADEAELRTRQRDRVGRLYSGAAALWVGGTTESEIETRKELAKRAAETLRSAIQKGVVKGGGCALLACRHELHQKMSGSSDIDAQAACRILENALEAPFRTILGNGGYSSGVIQNRLEETGPDAVFDVLQGQITSAAQSGILDVAVVQKEAIYSAVRGAALALTIDTVIHRRKPRVVTEPD